MTTRWICLPALLAPARSFRAMPSALLALSLSACAVNDPPVRKAVLTLAPVETAVAVPVAAVPLPPEPAASEAPRSVKPVEAAQAAQVMARPPAPPVFIRDLPTTIYYGNDAYLVAPQFRSMLSQHARNLKADPGLRMQVVAYTDARGPVDYNRALAQMRATTVIKTLAEMGVNRAQLEPQARGIERTNAKAGAGNEARSRRVELVYRR